MHLPDIEKKTFITPHRLSCYNVMPFGWKIVDATYQRLVTKIIQLMLGNTMEAYIDDMLVKSRECFDHIQHLKERKYVMKLNPLKCAFRVSSSKFIGCMETKRRIEANPV